MIHRSGCININKLRTLVLALGDLVSPHAHTGFPVIGKSGAALVAGSLAVPAVPENVTFGFIGEDTVQPLAVRSGNWGLCESKPIFRKTNQQNKSA